MKKLSLIAASCLLSTAIFAQAQVPEATELYVDLEKVTPGQGTAAPSDAIVLFSGRSLDNWQAQQIGFGAGMLQIKENIPKMDPEWKGEPAPWNLAGGAMIVAPGEGGIQTKQSFGDVQLHIEWMAPVDEGKSG